MNLPNLTRSRIQNSSDGSDRSFSITPGDGSVTGDVDGDGTVGIQDFLSLLGAWGPCEAPCPPSCAADFDEDCQVGITDVLILLGNWG